jgi:hypothetical protein
MAQGNGVGSIDLGATNQAVGEYERELGLVHAYLDKTKALPKELPLDVRLGMARFLRRLELREDVFDTGADVEKAEKYLALSYGDAVRARIGSDDPLDALRQKVSSTWEYEVDTYDTVVDQGVIPESIKAGGALDYVYVLGEKLGVFDLANALVMRWAVGRLDIGKNPDEAWSVQDRLYRYYKLHKERLSHAERAQLYRFALGKGNAELLEGAVANEEFGRAWETLMREAAEYLSKRELSENEHLVSRTPIYEAAYHVQVNLTEHVTGLALMDVRLLYAQFKEAMSILGDPMVINAVVGGRRKNVWSVIDTLAREEFGQIPNTAALRTEAIEGNKVFTWLATADRSVQDPAAFEQVRQSIESYIIARASLAEFEAIERAGFESDDEPSDIFQDEDFGDEGFEDF